MSKHGENPKPNGSPFACSAQGHPAQRVPSTYYCSFLFCTPHWRPLFTAFLSSLLVDKMSSILLPKGSPVQGSRETLHATQTGAGVRSLLFPPLSLISFTLRGGGRDCLTNDPPKPREVNAVISKPHFIGRYTTFHAAVREEIV